MEHLEVFDCSNILIACYFNDDRGCAHENREHTQKWIIKRRLEAARDLILSGKKKVTEACFDVGFKNLSHFSKIYKEAYGVAPSWR